MAHDDPLTERELELWHAFKDLSSAVQSLLNGELGRNVSAADFSILSRLDQLGAGQLAQSELLEALGWDKSRLSHQLTRMEARGLVKRQRSAASPTIVLQEQGRTLLAQARPLHAAAVRRGLTEQLTLTEAAVVVLLAQKLSRQGAQKPDMR